MKIEESEDGTVTIVADRRDTTTIRNALSYAVNTAPDTPLGRNALQPLAGFDKLLDFDTQSPADPNEVTDTDRLFEVRGALLAHYFMAREKRGQDAIADAGQWSDLLYTADTGRTAPIPPDEHLTAYLEQLDDEYEMYAQKKADEYAAWAEDHNPYEV